MSRVKAATKGRWALNKHEFYTAYHYALQYMDWLDQYNALKDSVGAIVTDGMPHGNTVGNPTQNLAIKRAELRQKMALIENTAMAADKSIWPWILLAVTKEGVTYASLACPSKSGDDPIPCGKDMFYDRRRKFYWLLAKNIS